MRNWNNVDMLDVIESFAADENRLFSGSFIESEEQLSQMFDDEILPDIVEEYGSDDYIAIYEAFNNWTDGLCTDGTLHELQYQNYIYVGKYN